MDTHDTAFPVRVTGRLDPGLSRGLWLVKWLLLVPHVIVLALLGIAFWVLTVVAFVAILVTARYPRTIFGFNVGVLRWGWRVAFYGYGANGTDRYPPFTLRDVPDYPARLEIDYPARLSRGLVLVKWWLLALPHYLVLAFLIGAGGTIVARIGTTGALSFDGGLVTLLVLIAAVALLFTRRYPPGLFDAVVGMDRWALRVAAYASLMTDRYPPFRLDQGAEEPAATEPVTADEVGDPIPEPGAGRAGTTVLERPSTTTATATPVETDVPPPSAGRSVVLTIGALVAALGLALAGTGLYGLGTDRAGRDAAGFVTTGARPVSTSGYALVSGPVVVPPVDAQTAAQLVGRVGVTATPAAGRPLFVGIGPTSDVDRYLNGVARSFVTGAAGDTPPAVTSGGPPAGPPAAQLFWTVRGQGAGLQAVSWTPQPGTWSLVVMNADGSAPVATTLAAAAQVPVLGVASAAVLVTGAGLLVVGFLVVVGAAWRRREPASAAR